MRFILLSIAYPKETSIERPLENSKTNSLNSTFNVDLKKYMYSPYVGNGIAKWTYWRNHWEEFIRIVFYSHDDRDRKSNYFDI